MRFIPKQRTAVTKNRKKLVSSSPFPITCPVRKELAKLDMELFFWNDDTDTPAPLHLQHKNLHQVSEYSSSAMIFKKKFLTSERNSKEGVTPYDKVFWTKSNFKGNKEEHSAKWRTSARRSQRRSSRVWNEHGSALFRLPRDIWERYTEKAMQKYFKLKLDNKSSIFYLFFLRVEDTLQFNCGFFASFGSASKNGI